MTDPSQSRRSRRSKLPTIVGLFGIAVLAASSVEGPSQGSDHFMHSGTCAICHAAGDRAVAMRSPLGDDQSPHGTWQGTMMANSFLDPYWRAQVAKEVALHPDQSEEIEGLCVTCHAPMAHHEARLEDYLPESIESCEVDRLARDGVSCTVCHQARPDNFGTPESFSGNLDIRPGRQIFGPYEDPPTGLMTGTTNFVPRFGPHVREAALCGSCHTLITHHGVGEEKKPFHEQTPYLEWRNSEFSNEGVLAETNASTSRTCQECHMLDVGTSRIVRDPDGGDLLTPVRDNVRAHGFVGGNAFMLDLMRANHEELELDAPPEAFARTAHMTRRQLALDTATVAIDEPRVVDGQLKFAVQVTNKTGHKLPTAYPARRVWLHVVVLTGRSAIFESGAVDGEGRLIGVEDELALPHFDEITASDEVQVWELITHDAAGELTTSLVDMATRAKDNRLLPRGWKHDGPHVDVTGVQGQAVVDANFVAGGDTVKVSVPLGQRRRGTFTIRASLRYQSIPPAWADSLRGVDTEEGQRFLRMYDQMPKTPETLGTTSRRFSAR